MTRTVPQHKLVLLDFNHLTVDRYMLKGMLQTYYM